MPNALATKVKHKARKEFRAWAFKLRRFKPLNTRTEDLYRGPYRLENFEPGYDEVRPNIDAMCNAVRQQLAANPFQSLPLSFNSSIMHIIESHDNLVEQLSQLTQIDEETALGPSVSRNTSHATPQAAPEATDRNISADLPQGPNNESSSQDVGKGPTLESGADSHHHERTFSFEPGDDADVFTLRRQSRSPSQTHLGDSGHSHLSTPVNSGEGSSQGRIAPSPSTAQSSYHPGFPSSTPRSSFRPGFASSTPRSSLHTGSASSNPQSSDRLMTVGGIIARDFASKAVIRASRGSRKN